MEAVRRWLVVTSSMICLGFDTTAKAAQIQAYVAERGIKKVFGLSPQKFQFTVEFEWVEWSDIIRYKYFYRLLQEINSDTLLVINECLRTQNRYDLTYNCIRNFLNQTTHQIVFQTYPIIDTFEDVMTLVDFETRSRWKRDKWRPDLLSELELKVHERPLSWSKVDVPTGPKLQEEYALTKRKLIDGIGLKDPHTIPRQLHLLSGKAKLPYVEGSKTYVGRNNRFGLTNLSPFKGGAYPPSHVFEFCHNFIDFSDYLALSGQTHVTALVSDLKVDQWYYQRYLDWTQRVRDAYTALR